MKGVAVQEVTNVDSAPGRPGRCGKRSLRGPRAQSTAGRDSPRWHHGAPFPCKERAAFFSAQRLLLTGSPALQQFDCCVQRKQHQSIKHGAAREPFASSWYSGKRISKQQGSRAKQKPQSQDCCVIWHILALPFILLQNLQGKAKASYLLIKVSHDSNIEQRTSPNRETCQPCCPCQQADVSVQCSPSTEWKSSGQWHIQMCTFTHTRFYAGMHTLPLMGFQRFHLSVFVKDTPDTLQTGH